MKWWQTADIITEKVRRHFQIPSRKGSKLSYILGSQDSVR